MTSDEFSQFGRNISKRYTVLDSRINLPYLVQIIQLNRIQTLFNILQSSIRIYFSPRIDNKIRVGVVWRLTFVVRLSFTRRVRSAFYYITAHHQHQQSDQRRLDSLGKLIFANFPRAGSLNGDSSIVSRTAQ